MAASTRVHAGDDRRRGDNARGRHLVDAGNDAAGRGTRVPAASPSMDKAYGNRARRPLIGLVGAAGFELRDPLLPKQMRYQAALRPDDRPEAERACIVPETFPASFQRRYEKVVDCSAITRHAREPPGRRTAGAPGFALNTE